MTRRRPAECAECAGVRARALADSPPRPFTAPRPAGRPASARPPSGRRAALALAVFVAGPPAAAWLATHDRPAQAGIAVGLILLHFLAELAAFEHRHPAPAPVRRPVRRVDGPLATYTPQTEDRLADWWEASRP